MHVMLACPGVGHMERGYERVTVELARRAATADLRTTLVAGGGAWLPSKERIRLPALQRESALTARLTPNPEAAYTLEQRTFSVGLYALLRAQSVDVVHLHDPAVMNALWHLRRRLGGRFALVFTNGGWLSPEHLFRADVLHVLTPVDHARMVAAGHDPARVVMVPYGVDPAPVHAVAPPGAPDVDRPLRVVGVGAHSVHKGVDVAVDAVAAMPGATLTFAGATTPESPAMQAQCAATLGARGSLITLPPEQVPGLLAGAHVFILPTQSEGFGMAVLEAMAAGLPCVVTDLPVLRWLVGEGGILVSGRNPADWTAALRRAHGDWPRLAAAARARAAQLGWDALMPHYQALYQQAATGR
jgi:1,2-diacylglycerol 3-alpha-glucosyltransferase